MVNTCITTFVILGFKDSLEKLKDFIDKTQKEAREQQYEWEMYDALKKLGIDDSAIHYNKRTTFKNVLLTTTQAISYPYEDDCLYIDAESAWIAPYKLLKLIIEELDLKNLSINYYAEERKSRYSELLNPDFIFDITLH